jgi:hypothetical protein
MVFLAYLGAFAKPVFLSQVAASLWQIGNIRAVSEPFETKPDESEGAVE